jgi:hypothetical protein
VKRCSWIGAAALAALFACATGTQDTTGDLGGGTDDASTASPEGGLPGDDGGTSPQPGKDAASTADGSSGPTDSGAKPDAGPVDAGCTVTTMNLLTNGNFDTGAAPWVSSGTPVIGTSAQIGQTPQSAPNAVKLAGKNSASDVVYQTVAIPANATAATLKGYTWVTTSDLGTYDYLRLQTRDSTGTKLEELTNFSPSSSDVSWVSFSKALPTVHAGQSIQIALVATTDSSLSTTFWVDGLDLEVTYCKY